MTRPSFADGGASPRWPSLSNETSVRHVRWWLCVLLVVCFSLTVRRAVSRPRDLSRPWEDEAERRGLRATPRKRHAPPSVRDAEQSLFQASLNATNEHLSKFGHRKLREVVPPARLGSLDRNVTFVEMDLEATTRLSRRLAAEARERVLDARPRIPYFLHLHKAGGTTVCHVARFVNGLTAPRRNCNMPGDGPRTLAAGQAGYGNRDWDDGACEPRANVVAASNLQFFAVERWLDVSMLASCRSRFFFATVIRAPVPRIVSHCRFERVPAEVALSWLRHAGVKTQKPVQLGPAVVDNFYTRSLLGRKAFFGIPPGRVTEEHALRAMRVLAQFDAVLILERLDDSLVQLYKRLGWCKPAAPEDTRRTFGPGDKSITFTPAQVDVLARLNAPDRAVYDFAAALALALEDAPSVANLEVRLCPKNGAAAAAAAAARGLPNDANDPPGVRRPPRRRGKRRRPQPPAANEMPSGNALLSSRRRRQF